MTDDFEIEQLRKAVHRYDRLLARRDAEVFALQAEVDRLRRQIRFINEGH